MKLIDRWVRQARRIGQLEAQLASTRELAAEYAGQLQVGDAQLREVRALLQDAHRSINLHPKTGQTKLKAAIDQLGGWEW